MAAECRLVVSAVLEASPDLHTITLSVAVAEANRPPNARSVSVNTFAVLATHRTSIAGPRLVSGHIQDYKIVPLQGNAW